MITILVSQLAGLVILFLLSIAWEMAVMKRILANPVWIKLVSVLAAYLTAGMLSALAVWAQATSLGLLPWVTILA